MRITTIFVVADEPDVHNLLSDLFDRENLHNEIFTTVESFLERISTEMSGCLLLDISLPGMGMEGLNNLLVQLGNKLPIITVGHSNDWRSAIEGLKKGALDFLEKPFAGEEVLEAVKHALQLNIDKRCYLRQRMEAQQRFGKLTKRESEVLGCMLESKASKDIADQLAMSIRTVEFHRSNIMKKMEADSPIDLGRMDAMAFGCYCVRNL